MIFKSFEINKINKKINQLILFYGKNDGLKNEALNILIKDENNILYYDEKEVLDNENSFIENILSKSLFEKEKFSGIIDFYFSCNDFFAFEIAICFNALCFDGATENLSFNVTKAKNFIDGYNSIRKITEIEKNSLKTLSQGAALRFLLTRVFDALNTVEGAIVKVKDPIEYLKRLEFHKNAKNFEDYFF